jgi:hypothetical protein
MDTTQPNERLTSASPLVAATEVEEPAFPDPLLEQQPSFKHIEFLRHLFFFLEQNSVHNL